MVSASDITPLRIGVAVALALYLIRRSLTKPKKLPLPPGPPSDPIIGSLRHFPTTDFPRVFCEWKELYGDIVYANVLGMSTVVLNSRKAIEDLMIERAPRYQNRPEMYMISELSGWGWNPAVKQAGPTLIEERKVILSGFGPTTVKQWDFIVEKTTSELLQQLADSKGDNLTQTLKDYLGSAVLQIAYGEGVFEAHGKDLIKANVDGIALSGYIMSNFWVVDVFKPLRYLPNWLPLGYLKLAAKSQVAGHRIRDLGFELASEEYKGDMVYPSFMRKSLEEGHDPEHVRTSVGIFYAAGLDTTYIALSTMFFAMLLYPEKQIKAQAEIDAFINAEGRLPAFEDRNNLPYIQNLMKELYRWNVPVPLSVAHANAEEDEYCGYRIPKNSTILPNVWQVMHDKDLWNDPDQFRPERFDEEGANELPDPALYIFGFGRRICPGKHFADRILYLAIVHILAVFKIEMAPGEVRPPVLFDLGFFSHPHMPKVHLSVRNKDMLPTP